MTDDNRVIDVSLVVMTYNRKESLGRCLESVTRIKNEEITFEVIVVDDGSETDNLSVIDQFKDSLAIRYYKKVHEGVASTRNFGLGKSRGNLVGFIADDYSLPDSYLPDVIEFFENYPEAMVITHNIRPTGPSVFRYVQSLYFQMTLLQRVNERDLKKDVVKSFDLPPSRGAVFRREIFETLGNFNEDFLTGEDGEFGMRMTSRGIPVYFFRNKFIDHWENKGLAGYLKQRTSYGRSYFRALKSRDPFGMGKQSSMSVFHSTFERYRLWLRLSSILDRSTEYILLTPFIVLFLICFYGGFHLESVKAVTDAEPAESGSGN